MKSLKEGLIGQAQNVFKTIRDNKYSKYIAIAGGIGAISFMGYTFIPFDQLGDNQASVSMVSIQEAPVLHNYYEVSLEGAIVGYAPDKASAFELYEDAYGNMVEQLGYDPDITPSFETKVISSESYDITDESMMEKALEKAMIASIDEVKVKGYAMKIGDDFVVALESEEALIEVLKDAQSIYVNDDSGISIDLIKDEHNKLVSVPQVTVMQKDLPEDRIFVTADMIGEPDVAETIEVSGDGSEPPMDNHEEAGEFVESVVKDVQLDQEIVVVETYVVPSEIKSVEEATQMITKENEKEKLYTVEKGDCPSVIAIENGMSTDALYSMNPGLKENASKMQIGDDVVIMVPEPELFVSTVEDVIYTEVIDKDVVYVNNPDAYIGEEEAIEPGSDGVMEVRATISKLNGKETDRVINEETVLLKPTSAKVLRGTMALPVTTATGEFDMPLISYTFTSGFGTRWGRLHAGIDLAAPTGTNVLASDGGRVIKAGWNGALGYMVEIDHGNGFTTVYGHNSELYVSVGDEVGKYQVIAAVGSTGNSTGPHCHFEIRVNGVAKNPMNYLK